VIREALHLLHELDDTPPQQMTALFYQHWPGKRWAASKDPAAGEASAARPTGSPGTAPIVQTVSGQLGLERTEPPTRVES
jgi:hypothetical protein